MKVAADAVAICGKDQCGEVRDGAGGGRQRRRRIGLKRGRNSVAGLRANLSDRSNISKLLRILQGSEQTDSSRVNENRKFANEARYQPPQLVLKSLAR
jgi:hypothetical protein